MLLTACAQRIKEHFHFVQHEFGQFETAIQFGRSHFVPILVHGGNFTHFRVNEQNESIRFVQGSDDFLLAQPFFVDGIGHVSNQFWMAGGQTFTGRIAEAERSIRFEFEHEQCVNVEMGKVPIGRRFYWSSNSHDGIFQLNI